MPRTAPNARRPDQLVRSSIQAAIGLAVIAFLLFYPAGTLWWPRGLRFFGILLGASVVVIALLWRLNPEIFVARRRIQEGTKAWDRRLIPWLTLSFAAILPIAALDDGRLHWSSVPDWLAALGNVIFLIGLAIVAWAEAVNRFFEPGVRIQTDRGHVVIDTGPYAYVRHPGYASTLLLLPGMALALGSYWALLPVVAAIVLLVIRTRLEEATLKAELPGYAEYTQRMKYRWIPGIW